MLREDAARPGLGGERRARQGADYGNNGHNYISATPSVWQGPKPLALQVFKRGRWCTVGKVTFLGGERIFAIAHDQQAGVETHLSIPEAALDFGKRWGCTAVYFWRRADLLARTISFADLPKAGYWGECVGNDALREWFFPVAVMRQVGLWSTPKWQWADEVFQIRSPEPARPKGPQGRQLELW